MRRGCLFGCLGTACLAAVLVAVWWSHAMAPPSVAIPPQKLPFRNAHDGYLGAIAAMVPSPLLKEPGTGTIAERKAVVARNAQSLFLLKQALALPHVEPRPAANWQGTGGPDYAKPRDLVRLLAVESSVCADRGEWGLAAQSGLDAVEFGNSFAQGSAVMGMLVGIAGESVGRKSVWAALPHLPPADARAASARLAQVIRQQASYADVITEEKWRTQANVLDALDQPGWVVVGAVVTVLRRGARGVPAAFTTSKSRILAEVGRVMDQCAANSRQPYARKPPPPALPKDPLTLMVMPMIEQGWFAHTRNRANDQILLVALALRAYRVEHGRYPDRLGQLVPAYLARVPEDPFALKGPLSYRRTGDRYVLYSVGPDGKDDGGKPVRDTSRNLSAGAIVEEESKGDMVAGINR